MNNLVKVRKYVGMVDETLHDGGPDLTKSVRKAVVGGVVANPFAGRYVEDLRPMVQALEPLAMELTNRLMKMLGATGQEFEAYGKGVIVGVAGELEHAAIWHEPAGVGVRKAMGGAKSIMPSTGKVAAAGLDVAELSSTIDALMRPPRAPMPGK